MKNDNLDIWENVFEKKEWGKYPPVPVIKFIAKNFYSVENKKEIKILEIGSGTGANLWFCAREGFNVFAIDGSQTAMDRMLSRFKEENLIDKIIGTKVGNYYDKLDELEDDYFDAIIDVESLSCNKFDKSKEMIAKCFNKLKVDGKFFSLTFADGTYGLIGEENDYHSMIPKDGPLSNIGLVRYTTKEDIDSLYKLKNNEIVNIERQELYLNEKDVIKEWIIELKKV